MSEDPSIALARTCKKILSAIADNNANDFAVWLTDAWLLIKMETNNCDREWTDEEFQRIAGFFNEAIKKTNG